MSYTIKFLSLLLILNLYSKYCFSQCSAEDIISFRKTAIVFGEKTYKENAALKNTINDARDISDSLKSVGFDVETYYDSDLKLMGQLMENWFQKLKDYDVALFYFSGHGSQVSDVNYLYPIDANPKSISDLSFQTYAANNIVERLSDSNLKCGIIILDACRSNPFTRSWTRNTNESGLTPMIGKGTFIGFAASPGKTALDGNERNGIYTKAILKYITKRDLTIDQIFNKVNNDVRLDTRGDQIPYKSSSLNSDFCFNVTYNKTDSFKKNIFSFFQSNSEIVLSPNEDDIFIADRDSNKVLIKSLNSTTSKYYFEGIIKPFKLISGQKFIYIIDSIQKCLFIVNPITKQIKSKVELKDSPFSFSVSINEKKAYILQLNRALKGICSVIDLQKFKTEKTIPLDSPANSIIISPNRTYLYVSTSTPTTSKLMIFETRNYKLIDSIKTTSAFKILAISPEGKYLFLSNIEAPQGKSELLVLNTKTLKVTDTIPIEVNAVNCSYDSNYIFALGNNIINVIRLKDKALTNKIPFATTPTGITVSNTYISYTWLPKERRIFIKDLKENLEANNILTPEEKYKNFLNQQKSKYISSNKDKATELFNYFDHKLVNEIISIQQELGASFDYFTKDPNNYDKRDFNELTYTRNAGIKSTFDDNKYISPTFLVRLVGNAFVFSISDFKNKSEIEKRTFPFTNMENLEKQSDELNKMIKEFFMKRIDQLQ